MKTLQKLDKPLAIAMWDSSWLRRHYRGGGFEDWDRALAELTDRGYNAVRIDAYPHLVARGPGGELTEVFKDIPNHHPNFYGFGMWGAQWTNYINPRQALAEFLRRCGEHGVKVGLSTWFKPTEDGRNEQIEGAEGVVRIWDETLRFLEGEGCLEPVIYLDVLNELPGGFCMQWFHDNLHLLRLPQPPEGQYFNDRQRDFIRSFISAVFEGLQKKWPQLSIGGSFGSVPGDDGLIDFSAMDFLDCHTWIQQNRALTEGTGYAETINRHGHPDHLFRREVVAGGGYAASRYRIIPQDVDYDKVYEKLLGRWRSQANEWRRWLEEAIDRAVGLGRKYGLPVGNTEGWGMILWTEHPLLDWHIQKEAAEIAVEHCLQKGYIFNCSANFCHPHHLGFWEDTAWHRRITGRIKSGRIEMNERGRKQ